MLRYGLRNSEVQYLVVFLQVFVDMTFGAGGHTRALLQRQTDITVFALDRDPDAHGLACRLNKSW